MATFCAAIIFGFTLFYCGKETISLEMRLLILTLCLIVLAIDLGANSITSAIKEAHSKENSKAETLPEPDETKLDEKKFGYDDDIDIDEYPHLHP